MKPVPKKHILGRNKGIDENLVKKQEQLEKELKKLGIDTHPKFRISPPLSSKKFLVCNK